MIPLNFPTYSFRLKESAEKKVMIFDIIRKKWLVLTPEEWVRQHWIHFFISELHVPITSFSIEKGLKVISRTKRTDLVIYKNNVPILLLECKAPEVKINEKSLQQVLNYHKTHPTKYLFVSNGINHFSWIFNEKTLSFSTLESFVNYSEW